MEVMWRGLLWFSLSPLGLAWCKACRQHALRLERVLASCVTGRVGVNEEPRSAASFRGAPEWHPGPLESPLLLLPPYLYGYQYTSLLTCRDQPCLDKLAKDDPPEVSQR